MSTLSDAHIIEAEPVVTIAVREIIAMADIAAFFDRTFPVLGAEIAAQGLTPLGAPYARYFGEPTDVVDIEVGFPVSTLPTENERVVSSSLPGGRIATATMHGSYDGLGAAWGTLYEWVLSHNEMVAPTMWEVYVTEPTPNMDPADLVTQLYWPIAD